MLKKVFSAHLSKQAYSYLTDSLCLQSEVEIGRAARVALKEALQCEEAQECAKRIEQMPIDFHAPMDSPRVVVSTTKCEREAIDLASKTLNVSSNQICSAIVNAAILSMFNIKKSRRQNSSRSIRGFDLNESQKSVLSHLEASGWDDLISLDGLGKKGGIKSAGEKTYENVPRVFFSELGTGSGKTLLALYLSAQSAKKGFRSWIAVPSLSIQKQFLSEFKSKFQANSKLALSVVSGRAEFVSEARLIELIDEEEAGAKKSRSRRECGSSEDWVGLAKEWMKTLADKPFGADRRRWLMDSFLASVPGYPHSDADICLTTEAAADDFGELSYQDQFDLADRSDIVVMTHHYLYLETIARLKSGLSGLKKNESAQTLLSELFKGHAEVRSMGQKMTPTAFIDLINEKNEIISTMIRPNEVGRLTLPETLIVDEAHLLEENFSKAGTIKISIRRLPVLFAQQCAAKQIKTDRSISQIQKKLTRICASLSEASPPQTGSPVLLSFSSMPSNGSSISSHIEDLASVMSEFSVVSAKDSGNSVLRSAQYALRQMIKGSRYNMGFFSNSPIRQYPQIHFGSTNNSAELGLLFKHLGLSRTLLLSATIYLPNVAGAWSSNRFLLGVGLKPQEAIGYRAPQESWLTSPVTLYLPPKPSDISKDFGPGRQLLIPSNSPEETKKWLSELSALSAWVADTAKGGLLVLMTSYESAYALYNKLLLTRADLSKRLLLSKPQVGHTVPELKRQFIELYHGGEKPIWIAIGSAWTGLNLSDPRISAENDNLLTDLIIGRMPYGTNRSISSEAKKLSSARHIQSLEEAGLTLKQGVGRLVRRVALPENRRIFFADARIYSKDRKPLMNMVNTLFRSYENRATLSRSVIKRLIESTDDPKENELAKKKASTPRVKAPVIPIKRGDRANTPAAVPKAGFGRPKGGAEDI